MNTLTPFAQRFNNIDLTLRKKVRKELNNLIDLEEKTKLNQKDYELKLVKKDLLRTFPLDVVAGFICYKYGVSIEAVKSKSRKRELAVPRQEAMYILSKSKSIHSLKEIGIYFGGRDHSTVIHSCAAIINQIDTVPGYKKEISKIFLQFDPEFNFRKKELLYLL